VLWQSSEVIVCGGGMCAYVFVCMCGRLSPSQLAAATPQNPSVIHKSIKTMYCDCESRSSSHRHSINAGMARIVSTPHV